MANHSAYFTAGFLPKDNQGDTGSHSAYFTAGFIPDDAAVGGGWTYKIMGIANASIAKVKAVAKASIAKIMGT